MKVNTMLREISEGEQEREMGGANMMEVYCMHI
jgi:hypothetical protein